MAENGPFGTPYLNQKIPPKKFTWAPFFWVLSQKMGHMNFYLGAQNRVFWVGAKRLMLKNVYVLFPSLK